MPNKSKIKIACGINNLAEIEPLIKAGVDEFFCGILSKQTLNGRPNIPQFNFNNLKELKKAIQICHSHNKEIWLTLNVNMLAGSMFEEVMDLFRKAVRLNIDGIIVADVLFLSEIASKRPNIKLAISTLLPKLNSESINFFKQFKISRLILERKTPIREIRLIDKNVKNIELEIIVWNDCNFGGVSAFCSFKQFTRLPHHYPSGYPCRVPLLMKVMPSINPKTEKFIISHLREKVSRDSASLFLSDLSNLFYLTGLKNQLILKIASRGFLLSSKFICVKCLKAALNFLSNKHPNYKNHRQFCGNLIHDQQNFKI